MSGGKKIWKFLLKLLGALVSIALLALLAASLILALAVTVCIEVWSRRKVLH